MSMTGQGGSMNLGQMIAAADTNSAVKERRTHLKAERKRKTPTTAKESKEQE